MLRLIIPHRCYGCLTVVPEPMVCAQCLANTPGDGQYYSVTPAISMVAAFAYASPLGDALKRIKRHGLRPGVEVLGRLLGGSGVVDGRYPLTYIPSPPIRVRRRGVDIAKSLATLSAAMAGEEPEVVQTLARQESGRQGKKSREGRLHMPRDLWYCPAPPPTRVVLIDDVRTTGTTTFLAASTLIKAGARAVLIVTLLGNGAPTIRG